MTNQELYELIALPAPIRAQYEAWDAAGESRMDAALQERLLCRETWSEAFQELADRLGPEDESHVRLLWEELTIAAAQYPRWQERGIPIEIYRDTMAFATRYLKDGLAAFGHYCFTAGWWFPRQLAMELFRLGSLEYELVRTEGTPEVYIHIPTDASLAPEALEDSLRKCREFTAGFYPEWKDAVIYCDSWLMSPSLETLLGKGSRILGFQDRFELLSVDQENMGAVGWVFPGPKKSYEELPEGTSLQRKMKAFLLAGGKPGWAKRRLKEL